jgi:ABC-type cobalamin/Fe3+-siderophores transport system ATPase subunit
MSLLSLQNVSFRYPGGEEVLSGLCLEVEKGTIAAVLGPNGCGKTTMLDIVARSLSQQPSLMLLDEPAGHLDPANAMLIVRLLRELREKGVTVLYTGHDPETAAISADTIHLLSAGRLRYSGPPREVLTQEALAAVYGVRPRIDWLGASPHIRWDDQDGGTARD